ncbi:hypothetical protein CEXT_769531 [Caerostris extrusa]|uniref:Uncharacterized protein n=1 Tax=Caerostris extrusa TaxID=172846 RepID=A0AAV4R0Y6_CAEEX|nr:hypothetical protein CEXT_769531 [Caerostris extrusa]
MKLPELSIHCIKKNSLQRKNRKNKIAPAILPKPLIPLPSEDDKTDKMKKVKVQIILNTSTDQHLSKGYLRMLFLIKVPHAIKHQKNSGRRNFCASN